MIDNEILRVALHYSLKGASDVMNVFHFQYQGAGDTDASVLADVETWLVDEWGADWANLTSDDANMLYADLDIISTLGTVVRNLGIATTPLIGGVAADEASVATSYFLLADTGFPTSRGKKYVPGVHDLAVVNGVITITHLALMVLLLSTWLTAVTTPLSGTLVPGLLSLTRAEFLPFTGSGLATDVPAYQRRRKPNVGS